MRVVEFNVDAQLLMKGTEDGLTTWQDARCRLVGREG